MDNMSTQQLCPLCQKPNACAIAQTGNMASHCWCMSVKITPEALAQLNAAQKNIACICQTCAGALKNL
jgi:hypothetical protein